MNKKLIFLCMFLMMPYCSAMHRDFYQAYVRTDPLPLALQHEIRSQQDVIHKALHGEMFAYHLQSGAWVKNKISRVVNAENMRKYIQRMGFNDLYVPKKYLYHIAGQPYDFDDFNYWVVVEGLELLSPHAIKLNLSKTRQLFMFLKNMGYYDIQGNVYLARIDGSIKLAIIDTEDASFESLVASGKEAGEIINDLLLMFLFEDDAFHYLMNQLELYGDSQDLDSDSQGEQSS